MASFNVSPPQNDILMRIRSTVSGGLLSHSSGITKACNRDGQRPRGFLDARFLGCKPNPPTRSWPGATLNPGKFAVAHCVVSPQFP